jgi:hypothetical protein
LTACAGSGGPPAVTSTIWSCTAFEPMSSTPSLIGAMYPFLGGLGPTHPPNTAGPAKVGMLKTRISSISVKRNQPAPCHAHQVSWLRHV